MSFSSFCSRIRHGLVILFLFVFTTGSGLLSLAPEASAQELADLETQIENVEDVGVLTNLIDTLQRLINVLLGKIADLTGLDEEEEEEPIVAPPTETVNADLPTEETVNDDNDGGIVNTIVNTFTGFFGGDDTDTINPNANPGDLCTATFRNPDQWHRASEFEGDDPLRCQIGEINFPEEDDGPDPILIQPLDLPEHCLDKTISIGPCDEANVAWEGENYRTINIGGQCWTENMNHEADEGWSPYLNGAATEPNPGDGRVYNTPAVANGDDTTNERYQGICPAGYHVPSECEFRALAAAMGDGFRASMDDPNGWDERFVGGWFATNVWNNYGSWTGGQYNTSTGDIAIGFTSEDSTTFDYEGKNWSRYAWSVRCIADGTEVTGQDLADGNAVIGGGNPPVDPDQPLLAQACESQPISQRSCDGLPGLVRIADSPGGNRKFNWPAAASGLAHDYELVEIGNQCWFAENLREQPSNVPGNWNWGGGADEPADGEGMAYDFNAAANGQPRASQMQGICPAGFHIPTDCEFMELERNAIGLSPEDQIRSGHRGAGNDLYDGGDSGFDATLTGYYHPPGPVWYARGVASYLFASDHYADLDRAMPTGRAIHSSHRSGFGRNNPTQISGYRHHLRCVRSGPGTGADINQAITNARNGGNTGNPQEDDDPNPRNIASGQDVTGPDGSLNRAVIDLADYGFELNGPEPHVVVTPRDYNADSVNQNTMDQSYCGYEKQSHLVFVVECWVSPDGTEAKVQSSFDWLAVQSKTHAVPPAPLLPGLDASCDEEPISIGNCNGDTVAWEGEDYKLTSIGGQCWTENMTHDVEFGTDWFLYNADQEHVPGAGRSYNITAIRDGYAGNEERFQGLCPDGYHVPSLCEFQALGEAIKDDFNALINNPDGWDEKYGGGWFATNLWNNSVSGSGLPTFATYQTSTGIKSVNVPSDQATEFTIGDSTRSRYTWSVRCIADGTEFTGKQLRTNEDGDAPITPTNTAGVQISPGLASGQNVAGPDGTLNRSRIDLADFGFDPHGEDPHIIVSEHDYNAQGIDGDTVDSSYCGFEKQSKLVFTVECWVSTDATDGKVQSTFDWFAVQPGSVGVAPVRPVQPALAPICDNSLISQGNCADIPGVVRIADSPGGNRKYNLPAAVSGAEFDYELVEIGNQCWFAENAQEGVGQYFGSVGAERIDGEGKLYTFSEVMSGNPGERNQGVCPAGFHVPSDCEFMALEGALGMTVQEQSTVHPVTYPEVWEQVRDGGASGFDRVLTGYWDPTGGGWIGRTNSAQFHISANAPGIGGYTMKRYSGRAYYRFQGASDAYRMGLRCLADGDAVLGRELVAGEISNITCPSQTQLDSETNTCKRLGTWDTLINNFAKVYDLNAANQYPVCSGQCLEGQFCSAKDDDYDSDSGAVDTWGLFPCKVDPSISVIPITGTSTGGTTEPGDDPQNMASGQGVAGPNDQTNQAVIDLEDYGFDPSGPDPHILVSQRDYNLAGTNDDTLDESYCGFVKLSKLVFRATCWVSPDNSGAKVQSSFDWIAIQGAGDGIVITEIDPLEPINGDTCTMQVCKGDLCGTCESPPLKLETGVCKSADGVCGDLPCASDDDQCLCLSGQDLSKCEDDGPVNCYLTPFHPECPAQNNPVCLIDPFTFGCPAINPCVPGRESPGSVCPQDGIRYCATNPSDPTCGTAVIDDDTCEFNRIDFCNSYQEGAEGCPVSPSVCQACVTGYNLVGNACELQ